jgi:hypothetical protein
VTLEDDNSLPEPRGDLVPPVRHPPTPAGAGMPPSGPRPSSVVRADAIQRPALVALLGHAFTLALDALDAAGDAVAERLGIRQAGG